MPDGAERVGVERRDTLNGALTSRTSLSQAQHIEVATLMSPHPLSSQGDWMVAANSVEGRFPFLDHRGVKFCNRLPLCFRIRGLKEKRVLSLGAIRASGVFTSQAVAQSVRKCRTGTHVSEGDDMALAGAPSAQLLHPMFVDEFPPRPMQEPPTIRVCRGEGATK